MNGRTDGSATEVKSSSAELLQALAVLASKTVAPLLDGMFGACDGALFDLASGAAGTYDEQRLLDFRRELQRKRTTIATRFVEQLMAEFARFQQPSASSERLNIDELTLIPPEQIERQLMVSGGVSRVRSELQLMLADLHERMLSLVPSAAEMNEADNPFDPGRIAQAFLDACQELESDIKCLRVLCQQFDAHVLGRLGAVYQRGNQVLVDARVLPLLGAAAARGNATPRRDQAPEPVVRADPDPADAVTPMAGAGTTAPGAVDMRGGFGELSALLQRVRGSGSPLTFTGLSPGGGIATAGAVSLGAGELVALLGDLQTGRGWPGGVAGTSADIRSALGSIAARRGALRLGAAEGDVVDIVTLIFDTLADDKDLPLAIQVLLSRLQLPVLKLALNDRGFFGDRLHPARQLINAIARAGRGWDGHEQDAQDTLLEQIRALVEGLAADAQAGREAFAQALQQLQCAIERAEQRAVKLERRTSEKAVADARLAAAREAVHAVMQQKLDGRDLPVALLEFFNADWQRTLQLFFLRKGPDSAEWLDAVAMVEDLPRSLVAPTDLLARGALARALPGIYARLEQALEHTQGNTVEAQARIEGIRELHHHLLEPPAAVSARVVPIERARIQPPPVIPPRANDRTVTRPAADTEAPRVALSLESLQRADAVAVGTWFEISDSTGSARRCKLSTRIDETRMLLFCDRNGRLVREASRKSFAYALQTGEWRIIEDEPLLERTLERITGDLRRRASAG